MNALKTTTNRRQQAGFTLVELLVVIAIIGVLVGLALPALRNALDAGNTTAIKVEVDSIAGAIESYQQEHGDYPPDFSDWTVVTRHYRKVFPRMSSDDLLLLQRMCDTSVPNDTDMSIAITGHDSTAMDRAEALVWALGNYSKDVQHPFTGTGGPLAWIGTGTYAAATQTAKQTPSNYQANADRVNSFVPLQGKINLKLVGTRYVSADDDDVLPTYSYKSSGAPYIYFDSRTYTYNAGGSNYNGYATSFGNVRPYYSTIEVPNPTGANYADAAAALKGYQFMNPNTFQLIAAGQDDSFGTTVMSSGAPVYFAFPDGFAITPRTNVSTASGLKVAATKGFQESAFSVTVYPQLDNITNFAKGKLVDSVK